MRLHNSQIVPMAFWVGFVALGLATGFAGARDHGHKAQVAKASATKTHVSTVSAMHDTARDERGAKID